MHVANILLGPWSEIFNFFIYCLSVGVVFSHHFLQIRQQRRQRIIINCIQQRIFVHSVIIYYLLEVFAIYIED